MTAPEGVFFDLVYSPLFSTFAILKVGLWSFPISPSDSKLQKGAP